VVAREPPFGYTPRLRTRLRSWEARRVYAGWSGVLAIHSRSGPSRQDRFRSVNRDLSDMALYEHLLIARQDISGQLVDAVGSDL
jgi:hypothetical protein